LLVRVAKASERKKGGETDNPHPSLLFARKKRGEKGEGSQFIKRSKKEKGSPPL